MHDEGNGELFCCEPTIRQPDRLLCDSRAFEPLVKGLSDNDTAVRRSAAKAIVTLARNNPGIVTRDIEKIIQEPHEDRWRGINHDCSVREHSDWGIGISFSDFQLYPSHIRLK